MTPLMQHAFAEAAKLPDAHQDAIAARVLQEIETDRHREPIEAEEPSSPPDVPIWDRIQAIMAEVPDS